MTDIEYLEKYLPKDKLEEGLKELEKGMPVQYIVGHVNFYGNIINVNKNVLIPRFETELLVEKTIEYAKKIFNKKVRILDIGTGSGAIAITLKKKLNSEVEALDISEKALKVAQENVLNNNVEINLFKSDIFQNVIKKYDIIISNPPYIGENEEVEEIVKNNEPHLALYAKNDGLEFYGKILKDINKHIKKPGLIALEIGMNQGKKITAIANKYINYKKISIEKDLTGKDRYIFIFI
ncbi:MAG: peptide chain release factor N(5)-glutamine methyltransferase [Clostridia bacterium]|nr:peptide chain release factor N(5)-glutamine methyltransferase [Clostridia bacterium]